MSDFEAGKSEVLNWVAEATEVAVDEIDLTKPLADIGLDSLDAVHMLAVIESILQQELPEEMIRQVTCLNDVFDLMREKLEAA